MPVRVKKLIFHDWQSLKLPSGWSDTFIFKMAPTDGLPPGDYAGVVRSIAVPLRKLRPTASIWVQIGDASIRAGRRKKTSLLINLAPDISPVQSPGSSEGRWYQAEVRHALRGARVPIAVSKGERHLQLLDFSFIPRLDRSPFPQPPAVDPSLNEGRPTPTELACLRVLARSNCAYTAEVASLANLTLNGARKVLRRLEEQRLVSYTDESKIPIWKIRRPGLSTVLRNWGVPPGRSFSNRKERGRDACTERMPIDWNKDNREGSKKLVSFTGVERVSFYALERKPSEERQKPTSGRHRRTARMWPAWLRQAWPHAELWASWTEVPCGRSRPDALVWGRFDGNEVLFWLEVESGHDSLKGLGNKMIHRINQALIYARRSQVNLIFVILGPPWVLEGVINIFRAVPADIAIVLSEWKEFGSLPKPSWGHVQK